VTGSNALGQAQTTISVQVTPALPPEVLSLADGFEVVRVAGSLAFPAKFAFAPAPDGRLYYNELKTGNVRILEGSAPKPVPFATLPVLTDAEQGLLGIAFPADFASTGHVYVFASTPAGSGHADRSRVVRFTAVADVGTAETVVVDDLPTAPAHTAGDVQVGPDDRLYVSVGDVLDPDLPQQDGSRAGRVLRYARDGTVPADNPIASDPEWVRGLRNSYDLAFHPVTNLLFASENGPTTDDEVNHLIGGRNYGWPTMGSGTPGPRIAHWFEVIAPTGIAWCTGGSFGPAFEDDLFVLGYVSSDVRRLDLSGPLHTDLDAEVPFLAFVDSGGVNKPLDAAMGPDGALYLSTPSAIWRVSKSP
jgi:glucose/arabinose dehydrogenase